MLCDIGIPEGLIASVQALLGSYIFKYGSDKIDQHYDEIDSISGEIIPQTLESFE